MCMMCVCVCCVTLQEDAFWCLVAIVEHIQPSEYYSADSMAASIADQRVLRGIIRHQSA